MRTPSFGWAVLANWMYFLSLGLSIPVLPRIISTIVNPDGSPKVSPAASRVSGDVEGLDKLLTFLTVGFHGALSDARGRRPLMALAAAGYMCTLLLQATTRSVPTLFLADLVDGATSCMNNVCQAYVADASPPERRAINIGVFQGLSVAGAFTIGFPISGVLAAKRGLRAPLYLAAAVQLVNLLVLAFVTPESNPPPPRAAGEAQGRGVVGGLLRGVDLREANPIGALRLLFGTSPLRRATALTFFWVWLANLSLNSQFVNYTNHVFGWGPKESGPLLCVVGLMLAIAPKVLVPRIGLEAAIRGGTLVYAAGKLAVGLADTPGRFFGAIWASSLGCVCVPALVAFLANTAAPAERGALLGGLQTLQELTAALGYPFYARLFAAFIRAPGSAAGGTGGPPLGALGAAVGAAAPFFAASGFLLVGAACAHVTFSRHRDAASRVLALSS